MELTRREALKLGLLGGAGLVLPVVGIGTGMARVARAQAVSSPSTEPFRVALPVPPVLKPVSKTETTDYYEVVHRAAQVEILPGYQTKIWGYNGLYPGPTIKQRSGRRIEVSHTNELQVPTVVHLHGGHVPAASDGYPTDYVQPGESRNYVYPGKQAAQTLWYHDHRMDFAGPQVYKGLAGFHIIKDDLEDSLPLPKGEYDIPLLIQDRIFKSNGALYYPSIDPSLQGEPGVIGDYHEGVFGDKILVNGRPQPFLNVGRRKYRFRLCNGSNARRYALALALGSSGRPMTQIGTDGGLLPAPVERDDPIYLSSGERAEVVIDFKDYSIGDKVVLKNLLGGSTTFDVMRFNVVRNSSDNSSVPDQLRPAQAYPASTKTRTFTFERTSGAWTINGQPWSETRIDAYPRLGSTETWEFVSLNDSHPVHLHGMPFKVIRRNGGPPGPDDAGAKDTVSVDTGDSVRVKVKFTDYAGRYVFHCHNLEHEDMRMMSQFKVVK